MRPEIRDLRQLMLSDEPLKVKGMLRSAAQACRWVQPRLLADVEFTEITPDGLVRHP